MLILKCFLHIQGEILNRPVGASGIQAQSKDGLGGITVLKAIR